MCIFLWFMTAISRNEGDLLKQKSLKTGNKFKQTLSSRLQKLWSFVTFVFLSEMTTMVMWNTILTVFGVEGEREVWKHTRTKSIWLSFLLVVKCIFLLKTTTFRSENVSPHFSFWKSENAVFLSAHINVHLLQRI